MFRFFQRKEWCSYSIQAGLFTGEGESEAQRKTSVLHAHVVEEVTDTMHDVIKQLEENKDNNVFQVFQRISSPHQWNGAHMGI